MPQPIPNGRALLSWLPLCAALLAIGVGWGQMTSAAEQTDKNTAAIEALKSDVNDIKVMQAEAR